MSINEAKHGWRMCYRCEGKTRKEIEQWDEDYKIYRGLVPGKTWGGVEAEEVAACENRKLQGTMEAAMKAAPPGKSKVV